MKERISPIGLKGNEINERMKELMGITLINENLVRSSVELTKMGPDGNIYGVVRENHEYYIKIATKKEGKLLAEDFSYIGGLKNKRQEVYPTYAKAIKQLNLKFNSLNEAYEKSGQINVFETDGFGLDEIALDEMDCDVDSLDIQEEELNPEMQAIDDMMFEKEAVKEKPVEPKLSIDRAINEMDEIIDSVVKPKKKVYTLK